MEAQFWWFGVNNVKKRSVNAKQHVIYPDIEPFLEGLKSEYEWPFHERARKHYEKIHQGDKAILWMGDGYFRGWGIIGFCEISKIKRENIPLTEQKFILKLEYVPSEPITPYPCKRPNETEVVKFFKRNFGLTFKPLGKTFSNVGYGTTRHIITIDSILQYQFEKALNYSKTEMKKVYCDEESELELYNEGALKTISVNTYKRNRQARAKCINKHGPICSVCGMDFEEQYGDVGKGFIHVHHLKQLSDIGKEYQLDPINDLIPVCPNCHSMIHRRNPPFTIDELRKFIKTNS